MLGRQDCATGHRQPKNLIGRIMQTCAVLRPQERAEAEKVIEAHVILVE